ncbi:MAG: hypothetical protein P1U63_05895 [Coxiellaceae bacterium]|nr:hypothetical protein [Coxiellaceae bacterium]
MRKILKHMVSDEMAGYFWNGICSSGADLELLHVGDFLQLFSGSRAGDIPKILAAYIEKYPKDYDEIVLINLKNKFRDWIVEEARFLNWGGSGEDIVIDHDFYEAFLFELNPTKRALFSGRPIDAIEWQQLFNVMPNVAKYYMFEAITDCDDADFALISSLPFFDPYAYLRGSNDYFSKIGSSEYLSDAQKSHRIETIKRLQQASCERIDRSYMTMHLPRLPFGHVDLAGFSTAIASDDPVMVPEDYTVEDCNPETIAKFFTLTAWLESQGFAAIAGKLRGNESIRSALVFQQIVPRLEVFCANIWSALQKPEFVETIYYDAGMELKALKCRENFTNTDIINQIGNCAEGVEEGFITLERFLDFPFHQKLFNDAKRAVLYRFHQQHGTPPGLEVHVDDAAFARGLGLYIPDAYKTDPYRLPVSSAHMRSLSQQFIPKFTSTMKSLQANVEHWLAMVSEQAIEQNYKSLEMLISAVGALAEIDIHMSPAQLLSDLTILNESESNEWCEAIIMGAVIPGNENNIDVVPELYHKLVAFVNKKFISQVAEEEVLFNFGVGGYFSAGLIKILTEDEDLTEDQQFILDAFLSAPDGLFIINETVEYLHSESTPIIPHRLLLRASNGESIFTAYAKDPYLSQIFIGAHVLNRGDGYEMRTHNDVSDLCDSLMASSGEAERIYNQQHESLISAQGAVEYWLGYLAQGYAGGEGEELLAGILTYLNDREIPCYTYDRFSELLKEFMCQGRYAKTLVIDFLEPRLQAQLTAGDYVAYLAMAVLLPEQTLDQVTLDAILTDGRVFESVESLLNFAEMIERSDFAIAIQAAEQAKLWQGMFDRDAAPSQYAIVSELMQVQDARVELYPIVSLINNTLHSARTQSEIFGDVYRITQQLKLVLNEEQCVSLYRYFIGYIAPDHTIYVGILLADLVCQDSSSLKILIGDLISQPLMEYKILDAMDLSNTIYALAKILGDESRGAIKHCVTHKNAKIVVQDEKQLLYVMNAVASALPAYAPENIKLLVKNADPYHFVTMAQLVRLVLSIDQSAGVSIAAILESLFTNANRIYDFDILFEVLVDVCGELQTASEPVLQVLLNPRKLSSKIKNELQLMRVVEVVFSALKSESHHIINNLMLDDCIFDCNFVGPVGGFKSLLKMIPRLHRIMGTEAKDTLVALVEKAVEKRVIGSVVRLTEVCATLPIEVSSRIDLNQMTRNLSPSPSATSSASDGCARIAPIDSPSAVLARFFAERRTPVNYVLIVGDTPEMGDGEEKPGADKGSGPGPN